MRCKPSFGRVLMAHLINVYQRGHLANIGRSERDLAERGIGSRMRFGKLVVRRFLQPAFGRATGTIAAVTNPAAIKIGGKFDKDKAFCISKIWRPVKGDNTSAFFFC